MMTMRLEYYLFRKALLWTLKMKNDKLRVPKFNFWGNEITGGKYAELMCLRVGFPMLASAKDEKDPTIVVVVALWYADYMRPEKQMLFLFSNQN